MHLFKKIITCNFTVYATRLSIFISFDILYSSSQKRKDRYIKPLRRHHMGHKENVCFVKVKEIIIIIIIETFIEEDEKDSRSIVHRTTMPQSPSQKAP